MSIPLYPLQRTRQPEISRTSICLAKQTDELTAQQGDGKGHPTKNSKLNCTTLSAAKIAAKIDQTDHLQPIMLTFLSVSVIPSSSTNKILENK